MSLFLDLSDRLRVTDFLQEVLPYLPADNLVRTRAEAVVRELADGEKVSPEALADLARTVGRATWAPRIAVRRYVAAGAGAEEEWRRICAGVSNSTGHLLERFKHGTSLVSIEEVLAHEESAVAFRDVERMEISEFRKHLLPIIWMEKREELANDAKTIGQRLETIEEKLKTLRTIAFEDPRAPEREIVAKVEQLEDQLYFEGVELEPKRIDAEIAAYREQIAIPADDE